MQLLDGDRSFRCGTRGSGVGGPGFRTDPMKSRFVPVLRQRSLVGLAAALVTGCFLRLRAPWPTRSAPASTCVRISGRISRRASRCTGRATTGRAGATSSSTRTTPKSPAAPIPTGAPRRVGRLLSTRRAAFSPASPSVTGSRTGSAWRWRPSTGSWSTTRPRRWRARRATPPGSWRARSCAPKTGSGACRHGASS